MKINKLTVISVVFLFFLYSVLFLFFPSEFLLTLAFHGDTGGGVSDGVGMGGDIGDTSRGSSTGRDGGRDGGGSGCVSNQGSSCNCNACGCGGTIQCSGACSGGAPGVPSNLGGACGDCGTISCSGSCSGQGVCTPETSQCVGTKLIQCSVVCQLDGGFVGTDLDGDGIDAECGDLVCDNAAGVSDATKTTSELGSCTSGLGTDGFFCSTCGDSLDNDCNNIVDFADQPSCCTTIQRTCKEYTESEFNTIHDTIGTSTTLRNAQTQDGRFFACPTSTTDLICCADFNSCVFSNVCFPDKFRGDVDGDGVGEVCVAGSPGQWIDDFEIECTDGIDNDFDGFIDAADSDCDGTISGIATDQDGNPIAGVKITVFDQNLNELATTTTLGDGSFSLTSQFGDLIVIASHPDFVSVTKPNQNLEPRGTITVDFTGPDALVEGTSCEDDCTFASDNIVHAACDLKNGCEFFDQQAALVCDNAQPGWIRDYSATQTIECAEGTPQTKIETKAVVTCEEENLIKLTKIVTYKGKPVKLVVVTCG